MIHRVVLDVELAQSEPLSQTRTSYKRCEPGMKPGLRIADDRQELTIAPEIFRPRGNRFASQTLDDFVIVDRLEGTQTFLADVGRLRGKHRLTQMTLQSDKGGHTASANDCSESPLTSRGSTSDGAGTIAARSRAISRTSPRMATAGASPPAPCPDNVMSPA